MDSDDTISPECGRKLRELANSQHPPGILGYIMQVHCPGSEEDGVTVVDHVKLFPNRPELRFEGRIHEQILPAIRRAGGDVQFTDIYVVHSGSVRTPEGHRRKLERDFRILHQELAEHPDHPFVLFNLGMTHADAKNFTDAVQFLRRCLDVTGPNESHLRKVYALLISCYYQMNQHRLGWETCRKGLESFPDDTELLFRAGMIQHHFGQLTEAERYYIQAIEQRPERYFASIDDGIGGYKARHNLALVYQDMGNLDRAAQQWQLILKERPEYRPACHGLADIWLKQDRFNALGDMVQRLKSDPQSHADGFLVLARVYERHGDIVAARRELEAGIAKHPGELLLLRELCRLLFECGAPAEAESALQRLSRVTPDDPSVLHNLGTTTFRLGKYSSAIEFYRRSLAIRPKTVSTLQHLGYALKAHDKLDEAMDVWREILVLAPQHSEALKALNEVSELRTSAV